MSAIHKILYDLPDHDVRFVADRFHVSESTVRRWIARGEIDYCRIGGLVRFTTSDIEDFIQRNHVEATPL